MNKTNLKSNLRYTYAELEAFTESLMDTMKKDIVYLSKYGISMEDIDDLKNLLQKFRDIPSDKEMQKGKVLISKRKTTINKELVKYLRDILLRVYSVVGKNSGIYEEFKVKNLSSLRDQKLLDEAVRIKELVVIHNEILKKRAYSRDDFVAFKSAIQRLQKAIDDYKKAVDRRKKLAQKRKNAANELYDKLVVLSDIGKNVWKIHENPVKYQNYLM